MKINYFLRLFMAFSLTNAAFAWEGVLNNQTDGDIKVTIEETSCSNSKYIIVKAFQSARYRTDGACCTGYLTLEGLGGSVSGWKNQQQPFALYPACWNWAVNLVRDDANHLIRAKITDYK